MAAAVQAAPVYLNREKTLDKVVALIEEASRQGAQFIVFPESFIPGYPYFAWLGTPMWYHKFFKEWFKNSVEVPSKTTDVLCEAARKANAYLAIGVTEREGNTCYNTILFNRQARSDLGEAQEADAHSCGEDRLGLWRWQGLF